MSLREEGKRRRRRRIVEAARVLIEDEGLEAFSMRRLAESAALSTRTLYNLYGAKEDILFALADECLDTIDALAHHADTPRDPLERSRALLVASLDQVAQNADLFRALLRSVDVAELDARQPGLMRRARILHQSAIEDATKAGLIGEQIPARLIAHQILAAYAAAVRQWSRDLLDFEELTAQVMHTWGLTLIAVARPDARERLLREIRTHGARVAATIDRMDALADAAEASSPDPD